MFFWFIGTSIVIVGSVFRDARFDYRLLIVGSVLPLADAVTGRAGPLHSVTVSIVLLAVVMIATAGRRPIRSMLLGLPIGMFLHLVVDGVWTDTDVFWWPFTGLGLADHPRLPVVERGWWSVGLELIGIVIVVWLWRANRLGDSTRRHQFLRDGYLTVATPLR